MGTWTLKESAWLLLASNPKIHPKQMEALFHVYPRIEDWYLDYGRDMRKSPELSGREKEKLILSSEKVEEGLRLQEELARMQVKFVSREHEQYPQRLKHLYDWPKGIFYRGELPDGGRPSAAIVGARNCSYYGKAAAEKLGAILSEAGVQVISGLAYGIDAYAHQGALMGNGRTFAVMGAGPENCYPKEHYYIYEEILKHGGILSEQPPNTEVRPYLFPLRNRIISALSDCVIVVEAREKSGSLITADQALEQGKDVFVVPGRMFDDLSLGCNRLIQSGAEIITEPADLLRYFGAETSAWEKQEVTDSILRFLSSEPMYIQEIMDQTGEELGAVSARLLALELSGAVSQPYPNYYVKEI